MFLACAAEKRLFLEAPPSELNRAPDEEGNEHQVWYLPETRSVLKATWPDFFGLLVVHRPDEEQAASPIAYLERWLLHNELFGDDVRFIGALTTDRGLRLLIHQPAIAGSPATDESIREFFASSGWKPFFADGNTAYLDPMRELVVSDTHRGNLILMQDGLLAPIDLRIQKVGGSLLASIQALCDRH